MYFTIKLVLRLYKKVGWNIVKNGTLAKALSLISQLGITMMTPILICTFIGVYIDEKTSKAPVFTIIFILLGTGGAFRNLFYHTSKQINKDQKNKKEDDYE